MPASAPRSTTDIMLAAAATGKVVTRDASGIALVTDTFTIAMTHHRAQDITQTFASDIALIVRQTRADGFDSSFGTGPPGPVGNVAFAIYNECRAGTPYVLPTLIADDGQFCSGQGIINSQMRRVDGSIIGIYGPGSTDVRPDGNWAAFRAGNSMHDAVTPQPNGYCYGATDRDAPDPRDVDGPYSKASGKLKWVIGPAGEEWRGLWLQEDPEANRDSKVWLHTATGNLTFESSVAATNTTIDIWRPSTAGVGSVTFGLGRRADGNADLTVTAQSSATADATATWTLSTAGGLVTVLTMASRNFASVSRPVAKIPHSLFANSNDSAQTIVMGVIPGNETLPGLWLGIDPTAQAFTNYTLLKSGTQLIFGVPSSGSFAWKVANAGCATLSGAGAFACNAGITTGDTLVVNTPGGTPVRVGWTGTGGEEPYAGIWFKSAPTLANFAFLSLSPSVVVNAENTGTLQLRIANGGGANFSQASTDLDRAAVGITIAGTRIQRAAAAPTSGTYVQGDIVYNTAPTASGFIGWVCVTSGSPGTWKTWGAISA